MQKKENIRVRIAPSPTGMLHFGTAQGALFNYLFAKKHQGAFVVRIEDTDKERSKKEYEDDILDGLKWLGLKWDELYHQSERAEVYEKYLKKLLDEGKAFWCSHSKEELEEEKKKQMAEKEAPRHVCDQQNNADIQKQKKGIIRLAGQEGEVVFNDLIKGKMSFDAKLLGNISIAKSENDVLFNFANVIDDHEMKISHVIRGEDHLPNTPKHILIYQALGFPTPEFCHFPMILNEDRSKMSKRKNEVSVTKYREDGYLPEAMVNFMALLGWNPGTEKEIFSVGELISEFSIERVHKGGAVFDIKKLDWFNGHYIRKMDLDELTKKCVPYLEKAELLDKATDFNWLKKVVALEQERMKKLSEIGESVDFFFKDKLNYEPELLIWKKMSLAEVKDNLRLTEEALSKLDEFDKEAIQNALKPLTEKYGNGNILWPLRVALTGKKASPGPYEVAEVLGKEKTLGRIKTAISN